MCETLEALNFFKTLMPALLNIEQQQSLAGIITKYIRVARRFATFSNAHAMET
jgi:hypothetical protein